jgi:hypothetical protein
MRFRAPALAAIVGILTLSACGRGGLVRHYEYEEEVFLSLDGSADVVVNASVPALVALRGLPLDADPTARFDRDAVRAAFAGEGVNVLRVSRPWRRAGRRYVQVRVSTEDVRNLARVAPFAWSRYDLARAGDEVTYTQVLGAPARAAAPPGAGWDGRELVAVRLHVPSQIRYHNAPTREIQRGNILAWEQALSDRLAGRPLQVEVRMDAQSILARTMLVFGLSVGAALLLLAAMVWWVVRTGRARARR